MTIEQWCNVLHWERKGGEDKFVDSHDVAQHAVVLLSVFHVSNASLHKQMNHECL